MAQADGVVANGTGSAVRSDINNQYAALWSNHSGSTEPSSGKVAFQTWADTNSGYLKIRNAANNGWVSLFKLDGTDIHFVNLNGSTNNTVCTVTGADAIQGEANLTFDGTNLGVGTATPYAYDTTSTNFEVKGSVASASEIEVARFRGGSDANGGIGVIRLTNDNDRGLVLKGGRESDNEFGEIGVSSFNGTFTSGLRIDSGGNVKINDGDLVIGTAGHGIDFSATSDAAGKTSELLDGYEEGTWTPTVAFGGNSTGVTYGDATGGSYVKIGRQVIVHGRLALNNKGSSTGNATIGGFPFAAANVTSGTSGLEGDAFFSYLHDIVSGEDHAHPLAYIAAGTTQLVLSWNNDSGDYAAITNSNFENDTSISFGVIYPA